jgi:hypothetical protein
MISQKPKPTRTIEIAFNNLHLLKENIAKIS